MPPPQTDPRPLIPAPVARPVPAPLRVVYLIDSLGPGGAETLLVAYLGHLIANHVEPVVAACQDRLGNPLAEPIRELGIPVVDLGIQRLLQRDAYRAVAGFIDATRPHLVHTQLEFSNILGTLAAHRRGIPTVSTIHTIDRPQPGSRDAKRFRLMSWVLRRYADRIIAVSESARVHQLAMARLRPEQVITLHNGIDVKAFTNTADAAAVRAEFGIPPAAPLAVTVAVLREPKGIQHMIAAMPRVLDAVPDAVYLIVGDGDHRPALEAAAAARGVSDRVIFAGLRRDIGRLLGAADAFVLPSLTEALPTVLAEAMAASLPIVATTVGGIPEMVADDHNGVLVPPGDAPALATAVVRLLGHPLQAAAMGRCGRRIAERRFDLRRQAAELVEEYRFLVGGGEP